MATLIKKIPRPAPPYAELKCRTNYSFLRGASHAAELVAQAAQIQLHALAITDRNGVYGIPKAYLASKEAPGFQLIVGGELTFEDHPHLTLLAQDLAGYSRLCRLLTHSHAGKPKGAAALGWQDFLDGVEKAPGLIALPADDARTDYATLKDIFGERLFLPITRYLDGHDRRRSARLKQISQQFALRLVATNDVHYHVPERQMLQDMLTAVRENQPLTELGGKLHANAERYLKSPQQMAELFRDLPDALAATVEIAQTCHFSPSELRYRYPSEWIPERESAQSYLEKLVWEGAAERYPTGTPAAVEAQLRHELALITQLAFADYFLTIWEIVTFARQRQILCQGRGSAANSVVCYCLGITAIDPVRMGLLFERFISVERGEPPDIDVDFEHNRREEVIQHIYEKYGRHRAAMVAAVITYRGRSARRDVCRALSLDYENWRRLPKAHADHQKVEILAAMLRDFPRHLSIHSGGFTLSALPLSDIVPIEPARMAGRTIVQWDKYDLEALGLLKVDILALGILTALREALALVGTHTLATIPAEDEKTYAMIREADSLGVFQLESRAQMNMSQRLLPRCYYDLVIQIALVRPGPIVGKMVHPYLKRRRGLEAATVPDARLEPILNRTLGVPIFQEQVMKIAIVLGNFTPGEADQLRKAIGAWRSSGSIEKMGHKLRAGLLANGLPLEYVDCIFEQLKGFAEYGFPESHSASFALLAYASAYLKCHHPAAFTCALINAQPMGFYAVHSLLDDAKRHGARLLPVDVNRSAWDCTLENGALRLGWRTVRHIHRAEVDQILAQRQEKPFQSLQDFMARVRLRSGMLQQLAMGDAFYSWGFDQRSALWEILRTQQIVRAGQEQMNLFGELPAAPHETPLFRPLTEYQAVCEDYKTYQLSLRAHPMQILRQAPGVPRITVQELRDLPPGETPRRIAGMVIVRQRPPTAKGTVFAALEDETGVLDLILHQKTYQRFEAVFLNHNFLIAEGRLQGDERALNLIVQHLEPLQCNPQSLQPLIKAYEWH